MTMITKEEMQAFYEQQIDEKGLTRFTAEALQWAINNKFITLERLKAWPIEEQQKALLRLMKMYSRSLM